MNSARDDITEQLLAIDDPLERGRFLLGNRSALDLALVQRLKKAVDFFIRSDAQRAMAIAETARAVAVVISDPIAEALSLRALAEAHHAQNSYELALEAYRASIAIYQERGLALEAARIQRNIIDVLMYQGRYQEALRVADQAREVAVAHDVPLLAAQIDTHVGNIHHRMDDFRTALVYYDRAHAYFANHDDAFSHALVEFNRANVLAQLNEFARAELLYSEAKRAFVARGMHVLAGHAQYSLAYLLYLKNALLPAIAVLSESRSLYEAAHDQRGIANCDLDLSELYLRVNLFDEAAAAAQKARAAFASLRLRYEEAKSSAHLAAALQQAGAGDKALELFKHAESLFRAEGNAIQVASVAMCRADLLLERGDTFGACRLIRHSIAVFEGHGATDRLCDAQLRLATALRRQGKTDRAWEIAFDACRLIADADRPWLAYRAQHQLAQMLFERGEIDAAEQHIDRALEEIELLWADLKIDEFRVPFLRDKEQVFVDAVRLRLAGNHEHRIALALRDVERCKSRTIVDMLTRRAAPHARSREGVDPVLYQRYRKLREELDWFLNRVGRREQSERPASRLDVTEIAPEVRRRERELAELRTLLKARDPEFSDVHGFATLDPSALQLTLKGNEVILEYFFAGEELLVFVVTRADIRVERATATRTQIEEHLEGLRFQLSKFLYGGDYASRHRVQLRAHTNRHLAALFEDLVAPVSRWLGEADLIIIPHGLLHYVPFHALVHDGQYLLQRHAISYAPSAHVWLMTDQRDLGSGQGVALFGASDSSAPFIDQELAQIGMLFPEARLVRGSDATRAALAALGASHRVLHIAAHAQFRTDSPMFSSIALADGPLTVYDIYNLELNAELVTLSGCETGVNQVGNGDELLGLMRAFLYAGTQSLVLSLWPVHDGSTAQLMQQFYDSLTRGLRPRQALRDAQLKMLHRHGHPFYWAPFFVSGRA